MTPDRRRWAVGYLISTWSLSIVRACRIAGLSRRAWYRPDPVVRLAAVDAPVIDALNEIIEKHGRWGFWKCYYRLRILGRKWNHKRIWRVYKAMKLNQKRRTKRRLPEREPAPLGVPPEVNNTWSFDFMSDTLYSGRRFRVLNIIDEGVREALDILDGSIAMHEDKIRQTAFFDVNKIRVPHMFVTIHRNAPRVKEFLESVKYADISVLDFDEITHSELNSYNFIARNFAASLDESEKKKQNAYELISNYTLQFFNTHLKNDPSAKSFLKQDSPAKDLLSITRKESLPLPQTQEEFFAIITDKDFETAYNIYKEIKNRDAAYQIFEPFEMTVLADRLFKAGREEDAIKAAKLRVEAYPNDYLSYEWVANIYYKMKDWQNALEYFSTAYGMALREKRTPEILSELDFYRKRIESVKSNL